MADARSAVAATTNDAYDGLSRLTRVTYQNGVTVAYTYDAAGNRLSEVVDTAAPTVTIEVPTAVGVYTTSAATLDVSGTAADDIAVAEVTWSNDRGGSGTAVGTTNWEVLGISLQPGDNVLTVTATDTVGKTAVDTLTVTLAASTPTDTPTQEPTAIPIGSNTPETSATPTQTAMSTPTFTGTSVATATFTYTPLTATETPTATPSVTPTDTPTATHTPTQAQTPTLTPTPSPTLTPSFTPRPSGTTTASPTPTATVTASPTATPTIAAPLAADLPATDNTVLVADINEFPDSGTIRIDDEEMTYNGKELLTAPSAFGAATASQPGWLLNVQRGVNGTAPAPHQSGALVILLSPPCVGDCNGNGSVTVDEILTMVNIALGSADVSTCLAGDANNDGQITIDEILSAVNNALSGCPGK